MAPIQTKFCHLYLVLIGFKSGLILCQMSHARVKKTDNRIY